MNRRLGAAALVLALGITGGCEELGNPLPGVGAGEPQLVRETPTRRGVLVTEVRYVPPDQAGALIRALRDDVDHVDPAVPPGGALVVVMVRPGTRAGLPPFLHLVTDFGYPNGLAERRVWVARTDRPRFVALFGLRGVPNDVRTDML